MDEYAAQTAIRHKLLDNGWRPLPTAAKVACLSGWNEIEITHDAIAKWPVSRTREDDTGTTRTVPAVTTAIQIEGNTVAIDVDCPDEQAAVAIEDLLYEVFGDDVVANMPFRACTDSHKFMVMARMKEPYRAYRTAKFEGNGATNMVEVFGGGTSRYFSCYGPHTIGPVEDGKYTVVKDYKWLKGPEPRTITPAQLPKISKKKLHKFLTRCAEVLGDLPHLERIKKSTGGELLGGTQYDLTGDEVFEVAGYGTMTYEQLVDHAERADNVRCSGSWLDDDDHASATRCAVSVSHKEHLIIYDFATDVTHKHPLDKPVDYSANAAELGAALREMMPEKTVEKAKAEAKAESELTDEMLEFEGWVDEFMQEFALDVKTGRVHTVTKGLAFSETGIVSALKDVYPSRVLEYTDEAGKTKKLHAVDAWKRRDDKMSVYGWRFDPRTSDRIVVDDGREYLNAFFDWRHEEVHASKRAKVFVDDYLLHLVPNEEERLYLVDWLADKYQRPWVRNTAIVFLADRIQGCGRTSFFEIMGKVFGGYRAPMTENDLFNGSFNGDMDCNLLITCDEIGGGSFYEKQATYEHLKNVVDPNNSSIRINRKFQAPYMAHTYVSIMLATNHHDAIAIDTQDRRLAVLQNGGKLSDEMKARKDALGDDAVVAAWRDLLANHKVTQQLTDAPIHFAGRALMLSGNMTEMDIAVRELIDEAEPWRAWTVPQFKALIKDKMPDAPHFKGLDKFVRGLYGTKGDNLGAHWSRAKMKVGALSTHVVMKDVALFESLGVKERDKVCNGIAPDEVVDNVVPLKKE